MSTASFTRRHRKRKLKSEINVVPYIDVMLVLLIIFMVTAPLLNLGVDIDLPKSNAKSIAQKQEPIVVVVDAAGGYTLKMQDIPQQKVDAAGLAAKVSAFVKNNPDVAVFVAGDRTASYDTVYQAMVLLQTAGVEKVGLMSNSAD
ncbi:MAG: protein TolR [Arenimonas sp.]|uniref:protein TolR n=1 Tax=Arenimonas sp. TaxID=1872635 RepID=UPI003C0B2034